MLRKDEMKQVSGERKAYVGPTVVARGDIMDVTKGGGLLPGDVALTLIDPGQTS